MHCKKKISRFVITTYVKSTIIYLVQITYNFEFLMIKLISFIVLINFFPVQ